MATDVPLRCECGKIRGLAEGVAQSEGTRCVCYCGDCQAFARFLGRDGILDGRIVLISMAALAGGAIGARLLTSWEIIDEVQAADLPLTYVVTHVPRSIIGGLVGGYVAIVLSKRALGYTRSTGD